MSATGRVLRFQMGSHVRDFLEVGWARLLAAVRLVALNGGPPLVRLLWFVLGGGPPAHTGERPTRLMRRWLNLGC